ncbi:hypothetical protein TNCT_236301 [Trichonephila clavata]|uniref:Uncharacterized protein n=1 Tax=Trichonephila clavata TaxID=2740835 RepID=A0A8X6FQX1_TRICU|nr:hypothetical protein TNCT_236301 [Trichonephila clavata]
MAAQRETTLSKYLLSFPTMFIFPKRGINEKGEGVKHHTMKDQLNSQNPGPPPLSLVDTRSAKDRTAIVVNQSVSFRLGDAGKGRIFLLPLVNPGNDSAEYRLDKHTLAGGY